MSVDLDDKVDDDDNDDDDDDDDDDDLLLLHSLSLAWVPPPQLELHAPHGPHSLQPGDHHDHPCCDRYIKYNNDHHSKIT